MKPKIPQMVLFGLVFGALALALVQPTQAGSAANPEITDPSGDADLFPGPGGSRDIVRIWVEDALVDVPDAGPSLVFAMDFAGDIQHLASAHALHERVRVAFVPSNPGGLPAGAVEAYVNLRPGTLGGTPPTTSETLSCGFGTATAAGGSANLVTEVALTTVVAQPHYECRLPVSLIGGFDSSKGHKLTGLSAEFQVVRRGPLSGSGAGTGDLAGVTVLHTHDRAPDSGVGRDYAGGSGSGNGTSPGDTDGDGLNDTCEQTYFGGLNSTHNGTGDADEDGLTNAHECGLGTDPTKPDTDGDGVNDKDDTAPLDPASGGSTGSQTQTATTGTSTSSSTSGSNGGTSTSRSDSSTKEDAGGDVKNLDDAVEKLQSDIGYLGTSAGGMVAVLLLAILALAVRWSL